MSEETVSALALLDELKALVKEENVFKIAGEVRDLRDKFKTWLEEQEATALEKFIAEGGDKEAFEYKEYTDEKAVFSALLKEFRAKLKEARTEADRKKKESLQQRAQLVEQMRTLVESEEQKGSFEKLKELQQAWRNVDGVPSNDSRQLWQEFNSLVNKFFNNRSIYFELKELDRKRNQEAREAICHKAEQLLKNDNLKEAIEEFKHLYYDYKSHGPVPREVRESLATRMEKVSEQLHAKVEEVVEQRRAEQEKNSELKKALLEKVEAFTNFASDRIDDWLAKTKELQDLQKEWDAIGQPLRSESKEITKKFWAAFKTFFRNKNNFFDALEAQREQNLENKLKLCEQAENLIESEDLTDTADKLKDLQQQWKKIGPTPRRDKDKAYKRFKSALDKFFARKREANAEKEKEFEANLTAKEALCQELVKLIESKQGKEEDLKNLQQQFDQIGFVPIKQKNAIADKWLALTRQFINSMQLNHVEKEQMEVNMQIEQASGNPQAKRNLEQKVMRMRDKIRAIENDLATWKNNIEFFRLSKGATDFVSQFEDKINKGEEEVNDMRRKINIINNALNSL